jgi:hypothetical protein
MVSELVGRPGDSRPSASQQDSAMDDVIEFARGGAPLVLSEVRGAQKARHG